VVAGTVVTRDGFILDLAIIGGDSGSPVIADDGRVLGIMFANAHDVDGVSYAVSSTEIVKVLAAVKAGTAPTTRPPC
jgi:S1-C subfamily serine protease